MAAPPDPPLKTAAPVDAELAAALDEAIDARQHGRPFDRGRLLARYPQLAEALAALDDLGGEPLAPPAPPLPEQIGPYRVEAILGAGGFGLVYRAYDPDVRRLVALKVLQPARLAQPEALDRFQR